MLDTTMAFTAYVTDPYRYGHQIEALVCLDLGDAWLRPVLWTAPAALPGIAG